MTNATKGYTGNIEPLCKVYDALDPKKVLPGFFDILDKYRGKDTNVLDIGCGSGRDALYIATKYKFNVTACDGSLDMIEWAKKNNQHDKVAYIHATAPELAALKGINNTFQVFLMSGFWMHMKPEEVSLLLKNIARLAAPDAELYISVRRGPVPEGRIMYDYNPDDMQKLAKENGFKCEFLSSEIDIKTQNAPKKRGEGVSWDYYRLSI